MGGFGLWRLYYSHSGSCYASVPDTNLLFLYDLILVLVDVHKILD